MTTTQSVDEEKTEATKLKDEGNELFKAKSYLKAAACYKKATAKDPTMHTAFSNLSAALLAINKYSQALDAADACLRICPEFTKVIASLTKQCPLIVLISGPAP